METTIGNTICTILLFKYLLTEHQLNGKKFSSPDSIRFVAMGDDTQFCAEECVLKAFQPYVCDIFATPEYEKS